MPLLKLCFFLLITALAGSPTVGTLTLQIHEYDVPTPQSRPHDPAVAPDGSLWYTGQAANKLGRLDPHTAAFKEYPLKTPHSGPHGLVADKDGNIWFTAISAGYVGKLDPRNGEITEIALPMARTSIRTRLFSTTTAFYGSPTRRPTMSAVSIERPAK